MDQIVKYGLVILNKGKFLINRKIGTEKFLMPGGKPLANESTKDCLAREIKEEHQVEVLKDTIKYFGDFKDLAANEPNTIVRIKVYLGKITGRPKISAEIEEQRWFGSKDDPQILSAIIKNKILPALIKQKIID